MLIVISKNNQAGSIIVCVSKKSQNRLLSFLFTMLFVCLKITLAGYHNKNQASNCTVMNPVIPMIRVEIV